MSDENIVYVGQASKNIAPSTGSKSSYMVRYKGHGQFLGNESELWGYLMALNNVIGGISGLMIRDFPSGDDFYGYKKAKVLDNDVKQRLRSTFPNI